jgi:tartrate dehydratase alpha subunit/fumarate hydratase class I-like protein
MLETVMMVVMMMVTMIERCLRGRASSHMARGPVVVTITSVGGGRLELRPMWKGGGAETRTSWNHLQVGEILVKKKRFVMMKIYRSGSLFLYNTNLI